MIQEWGSRALKKLFNEIRPRKKTPAGSKLAEEASLACFVQAEGQRGERLF